MWFFDLFFDISKKVLFLKNRNFFRSKNRNFSDLKQKIERPSANSYVSVECARIGSNMHVFLLIQAAPKTTSTFRTEFESRIFSPPAPLKIFKATIPYLSQKIQASDFPLPNCISSKTFAVSETISKQKQMFVSEAVQMKS